MPAEVFAFLSDGIVQHAGRCWRLLLCAHISGHIFGVLSSLGVRITAHSGGCRNSAMVMGCWPTGSCCWASSQLLLSTVRGLNMQTRVVCLDSVDSVRGLTVRYHLPICTLTTGAPPQFCWISRLHRRRWVTLWTRICCRNCLEKHGWRPRYRMNLQLICHWLDQIWILLWHLGKMRP